MDARTTPETCQPAEALHGDRRWVSTYLYPDGSLDEYCRTHLRPLVAAVAGSNGSERPFFFVRYSDSLGPHLRLRILDEGIGTVRALLEDYFQTTLPAHAARRARPTTHGVRLIRSVPYRPEVSRYGGPALLPASEHYFVESSRWVIEQDLYGQRTYTQRLAAAAMCIVIMLWRFHNTAVGRASFLSSSVQSMQRYLVRVLDPGIPEKLNAQWQRDSGAWCANLEGFVGYLDPRANLPRYAGCWRRLADECVGRLEAAAPTAVARRARISVSWHHMHCNRLGIQLQDELLILDSVRRFQVQRLP